MSDNDSMAPLQMTIDGTVVEVASGSSVLEACSAIGVTTPTLCYAENLTPPSACRLCVVELEGSRTLVPSCSRPATDGMVIKLDDLQLQTALGVVGKDPRGAVAYKYPSQEVMTTLNDPFNRRTVLNYLKELKQRVYPVGRLDFDTRGLLMLTNDGELAFRLAHPSFVIEKVYEARVRGYFKNSSAEKISEGIELEDGHIGRGKVTVLKHENNESNIRIILTEGRKREVKQLCKIVGHPVLKLTRTKFAGLSLAGLASGQWRNLTEREIAKLKEMAGLGKVS